METDPPHDPIPWAWESSEEITAIASQTMRVTTTWLRQGVPDQICATGRCPSCKGEMSAIRTISSQLGGAASETRGAADLFVPVAVVEFECECAHVHPEAKNGLRGCGRYWALEIGKP